MKPALLVIDMQKEFYKNSPATAQSMDGAVEYINAAIALFREKQLPVVCVQHMHTGDNLVPGEPGFEVLDEIELLPADLRVHKTYGNSFNKTPLADELRQQGIDTVIVTGFAAEGCVLSTCRGARDCDLASIILRGSLANPRPDYIPFVENISDVISYGALKKVLE